MKRFMSFIFLVLMSISFCACGDTNTKNSLNEQTVISEIETKEVKREEEQQNDTFSENHEPERTEGTKEITVASGEEVEISKDIAVSVVSCYAETFYDYDMREVGTSIFKEDNKGSIEIVLEVKNIGNKEICTEHFGMNAFGEIRTDNPDMPVFYLISNNIKSGLSGFFYGISGSTASGETILPDGKLFAALTKDITITEDIEETVKGSYIILPLENLSYVFPLEDIPFEPFSMIK